MGKQRKELTLNKETLRDLTTQNAAEVKGASAGRLSCGCTAGPCTYTCVKCHGHTYNKKCGS